ncbi:MAG TPA: dTDP-4-dehydrorhamnose 3,5-epimerase [Chitinophagaceae bacterium]|jgi:dTDP-4-dehydrorhamnose 3,5-epimerase|nr:dTDP-4-dehydrorhamnose 3,5-epimerase [Chitinophagaceae bacterium]
MIFDQTPLAGSYIVSLQPFTDNRGWFARFYCKDEFKQIGHNQEWVQLNHSVTFEKGSIRGMHYQVSPYQEIKMVRCISGAVYDVIIDLRKESNTFMKWFGTELSAENRKMLYIPKGFAHGFQTLTENCELIYHHTEMYTPNAEAGLRFNDPAINISWPLPLSIISEKDAKFPYTYNKFKGI